MAESKKELAKKMRPNPGYEDTEGRQDLYKF